MASSGRAQLDRVQLDRAGFVVLAAEIEPAPLVAEVDDALRHGFGPGAGHRAGPVGNRFRYVPMMCERTPVSLGLLVRLAARAEELLDAAVLPGRAKATEYVGATPWHRDATGPVRSIAFVAYLDPLAAGSGALRVRPGSHRPDQPADRPPGPAVALPTVPGDLIVFDEHLCHASHGGGVRRQWRVDFVADDGDGDDGLRGYYAAQHPPGWDGGYDVGRFPSYGPHWRRLDERWNDRLRALGAYAAAAAEERLASASRTSRRGKVDP